MQTRRERVRASTRDEIKTIARRHMAEQGTAALSLRAIARDMGMTAPGLYRYFPTRDDLITALILDGFNALADVLEAADASQSEPDHAGRLREVFWVYRQWALTHPTDFQLIYGNPIPGYVAPGEITIPAVVRGFTVVVRILASALQAGELSASADSLPLPSTVERHLIELIERDQHGIPPQLLYFAVVAWTRIHGIIMLELFHHLPPVIGDVDAFYRVEVTHVMQQMGLKGA